MPTLAPTATHAADHWNRIGFRHHHGIDIPLASIHTRNSGGIGEFLDLHPLIDWCADVGFDVIQLLPLNDSGHDPSPYNAQSSCALHPIYVSLYALEGIEDTATEEELSTLRRLTAHHRIAYTAVHTQKMALLDRYLDRHQETIASTAAFQTFFRRNPWTAGYGLYKTLKGENEGAHWNRWPSPQRHPTAEDFDTLIDLHEYAIERHCVIQFLCWQQLHAARCHAEKRGVLLKGDIPILLSPDSADVWLAPALFDTALCAGAPPDAYAKNGQNWGFPLYDWDAHAEDGYAWWRQRLAVAEQYYHLYRLDHIIGFFRLWAVPPGRSGKHGHFIPADEGAWVPHGETILSMMLDSSRMLPIGEDLGVIPDSVRACMERLGISGTKVMRWERHWEGEAAFHSPHTYSPYSMTTVSTHDSETLGQWWELRSKEARHLCRTHGWKYRAPLSAEHREAILHDSHHSSSLFHINLLQEYLGLYPELVHDKPGQERINTPGTVTEKNWTYRYRPTVEAIAKHQGLREAITRILKGDR